MQRKLFLTISVFVLFLGLSVSAFADTIHLKDGSTVKGKVVGFRDQQFVILVGDGSKGRRSEMKLYPEDIEFIEFEGEATPIAVKPLPPPSNSGNSPVRNNPTESTGRDSGNTNTNSSNSTGGTRTDERNPLIIGKNSGNSNTSTRPNSNGSVVQVINSEPPSASSNANSNSNTSGSGSTVITGANTSSNPPPPPSANSGSGNSNTSSNTTNSSGTRVTMNVKVLADNTANGWTNAGIVLKKGQRLRISSIGRVSLGNGRFSTPAGVSSLPDKDKLMQNEPTGALIAVVGLDNNDFVFIGSNREFIAQRDGILFLGVNDGFLDDNSGAFEVKVEVENK